MSVLRWDTVREMESLIPARHRNCIKNSMGLWTQGLQSQRSSNGYNNNISQADQSSVDFYMNPLSFILFFFTSPSFSLHPQLCEWQVESLPLTEGVWNTLSDIWSEKSQGYDFTPSPKLPPVIWKWTLHAKPQFLHSSRDIAIAPWLHLLPS